MQAWYDRPQADRIFKAPSNPYRLRMLLRFVGAVVLFFVFGWGAISGLQSYGRSSALGQALQAVQEDRVTPLGAVAPFKTSTPRPRPSAGGLDPV